MARHLVLLVSATMLIAVGGWTVAAAGRSAAAKAESDAKVELMDADRAFAKATADKGLDGWVSVFADDAVRIAPLGGKAAAGKDAIRKLDAPLFADTKRLLIWEPTDAGVFADGKHGFTTGRAKVIDRGAGDRAGSPWPVKYVTFWRKGEDGRWQVILDTGASDPPKP
jgi:ketosteroid isomerase-like protein